MKVLNNPPSSVFALVWINVDAVMFVSSAEYLAFGLEISLVKYLRREVSNCHAGCFSCYHYACSQYL